MAFLSNLSIGRRLALAFLLLLASMLAAIGAGVWQMREMDHRTVRLVAEDYAVVTEATTALDNVRGSIARVFQLTADTDAGRQKHAAERLDANLKAADDALAGIARRAPGGKLKQALDDSTGARDRYHAAIAQVRQALVAGDRAQASQLAFGPTYAALQSLAKALRVLLDEADNALDRTADENAAAYRSARNAISALGAGALLLGLAAGWAITRSITRPLAQAVALADRVATGDLGAPVPAAAADETGRLLAALGRMQLALGDIVGRVREASEHIVTGSTQIASGSADLSQRTEQQAGNLQQTAATMEQITGTVQASADTAARASALAGEASASAGAGGLAMDRVVETMDAIAESSARVQEIVGLIDAIAFQTNILALNAAVEAARAGDHGRGFAVVASEVRTLAQRSAEAAREIRALIARSGETVAEGSRLVSETRGAIGLVVGQVADVRTLIAQLGEATGRQRTGAGQVGNALQQLDSVTQQNAALVEESAAAAESLRRQAELLGGCVARFRLAPAA